MVGGGGWFGKKSTKSTKSTESTKSPKSPKGTEGETPQKRNFAYLKLAHKSAMARVLIDEYKKHKNGKLGNLFFIRNKMKTFLNKNKNLSKYISLPKSTDNFAVALDRSKYYDKLSKQRKGKEATEAYNIMVDFFKNKKNNTTQELKENLKKFYTTFSNKDESQEAFEIKLNQMLEPKLQKQKKSQKPQKPQKQQTPQTQQQTPQTPQTQQTQQTPQTQQQIPKDVGYITVMP